MKHVIILALIALVAFQACENEKSSKNNDYSDRDEISINTPSPGWLGYDGDYLWYSDDSLHTLNKVSPDGNILKTIGLENYHNTDFDFYNNYIWCINDNSYPYNYNPSFSCIYKYSMAGKLLDSVLLENSGDPTKPGFVGVAVCDSMIYCAKNQGYSSGLYGFSFNSGNMNFLKFQYFEGMTIHNDTIFAIDKSSAGKKRIVCLDSDYNIIENHIINIDYDAEDVAFVNDDIWICDRKNRKLIKVK